MVSRQDYQDVAAKKLAIQSGDEKLKAQQTKEGKLTARERAAKLLDQGSFVEMDALTAAGVVTGYGTANGRPIYLFAQDYTQKGGAMCEAQAKKIIKVLEMARKTGAPVVAMLDSQGVSLNEGMAPMKGYAMVMSQMARLSGVCPMFALVLGNCIGTAAMLVQLCDVSVMAKNVGALAAFGPQVLASANHIDTDLKKNAGGDVMAEQGAVSLVAQNEEEAFNLVKTVIDLMPACNMEDAEIVDTDDMNRTIPTLEAADVPALLAALCDNGAYVELNKEFGKAAVTALARMGGRTVALVAGSGELTACAMKKAARFVRMADCFHVPVVTLVNTQGVKVPEVDGQKKLLAAGAQLFYAYAEATAPKLTVITGDAIGQAYVTLCGSADVNYAWPGAVISALTAQAAAHVLEKDADAYIEETASAVVAAQNGLVDDVIDPSMTRQMIIANLEMLASKRDTNYPKKHGNLPL